MTVQTQDQSIWKWKNTAHISKAGLQASFAIAAIAIAATTIYAAAKGIALSSLLPVFLANPWVIAAIAFVAAMFLIATAISSYQQLYSMEGAKSQDGQPGQKGDNADFSILLGDAVKVAEIVEKEVTEGDNTVKKLCLELSFDNRRPWLDKGTEGELYVIFKKEDGEYQSKTLTYEFKDSNVVVKSVGNTAVNDLAAVRKALGVDEKADLSAVAVSKKDYEALQSDVPVKLKEVAVNAAITKATGK